jgi:hypothetical protein
LGEDHSDGQREPDAEYDEHPGGNTGTSQECATSEEARSDTQAHVNDQPIPSPAHEGLGQPARTQASKN